MFFLLFSGIKVNFVNKVMQSNCLCVILPDKRKNSLILTVAKKRMAVLVYRSALTWLATLSSPSLGKNGWLRPRASKFVLLSVFSLSKTIWFDRKFKQNNCPRIKRRLCLGMSIGQVLQKKKKEKNNSKKFF